MKDFIIAIDGPAGSGKSTISNLIAIKTGFTHVDTGSMYRAVTLKALKLNIDLSVESNYTFLDTTKLSYQDEKIYLDSIDVSQEIRSSEVSKNVSIVASFPSVRKKMVLLQQSITGNLVIDGRDIGSVVFPNADLKIFLTANIDERTKRRLLELREKGEILPFEILKSDLIRRDEMDSNRKESPLIVPNDAIIIDSSNSTIDEVANKIISLLNKLRGIKIWVLKN